MKKRLAIIGAALSMALFILPFSGCSGQVVDSETPSEATTLNQDADIEDATQTLDSSVDNDSINEANSRVLDSYKALGFNMGIDEISQSIIEQVANWNVYIDGQMGWGLEHGYDPDIFSASYDRNDSLIKMMETGAAVLSGLVYPLEEQAAQIRYSVFTQTQWKDISSSPVLYDCLYHWFKQGHFELETIEQIVLQFVDGDVTFDELYSVSVQAKIVANDENYIAYLCPMQYNDGSHNWVVLDIFKVSESPSNTPFIDATSIGNTVEIPEQPRETYIYDDTTTEVDGWIYDVNGNIIGGVEYGNDGEGIS